MNAIRPRAYLEFNARALLVSTLFGWCTANASRLAVDAKEQIACRQTLNRHFARTKIYKPVSHDAQAIERRAVLIDSAFAQTWRPRYSKNARKEIVVEFSSRIQPSGLKLLIDSDHIVLGYQLTKSRLTRFYCSDILR